ncbi:MAG: thiamine pyrophosphate-dependent enzyme, partial [Betaproteobacteria bacterium]|nr:thiamine pyrophosphate-dependent enzyme [Betaproteobacteria bacterium]
HRGAIDVHFLCAELGRVLDPEDVVVNEAIRNTPAVLAQIPRNRPLSLIGRSGGGGLGWSGGTALGVKLARPRATVVQICGDGSFYLGAPEAVLATARQYALPILTVVLDNAGWAAVKDATLAVYPEGRARTSDEFQARLAPDMDFAKLAESAAAYGERVSEPDALRGALERCLAAVRAGRSAVLHAQVTPL